jgi:hypothetical protein
MSHQAASLLFFAASRASVVRCIKRNKNKTKQNKQNKTKQKTKKKTPRVAQSCMVAVEDRPFNYFI